MKKMLYILNQANRVNNFSYTSMLAAQALGYDFHIAGNWNYPSEQEKKADEKKYGIHIHQIDFIRIPYRIGNFRAYKQVKILVENERFDIIHCNTPIGGVVGRIVGRSCKVPVVIYQAHGFHFYRGAPIKNWIVYYTIEKILARSTDVLITINKEDFERAKRFHLHRNGRVYYVPGVGIDVDKYDMDAAKRDITRKKLGLNDQNIMIISVGDLIDRKNYQTAIKAVKKTNNENLHFFICGEGPEINRLKKNCKRLGVEKQIHFLGYRSDVNELLKAADVFLLTSTQEGLPRSLMEAMACGLPCIVSKIRGNTDLINEQSGLLAKPYDYELFAKHLSMLIENPKLRDKLSSASKQSISGFSVDAVIKEIEHIYKIEIGN